MVKPTHPPTLEDSIFADESLFLLSLKMVTFVSSDGLVNALRLTVMPVDRCASDSFMVLAGVHCARERFIVRRQTLNYVHRYCDDILHSVVVPVMLRNNRFVFQQDNHQRHVALLSLNFYRPTMLTHYPGRFVLLIWLLSNRYGT